MNGGEDGPSVHLARREAEVLELLVAGKTTAQIAESMGISEKTVRTYRQRLMERFGVEGLIPMVLEAIRRGFVDLGDSGGDRND